MDRRGKLRRVGKAGGKAAGTRMSTTMKRPAAARGLPVSKRPATSRVEASDGQLMVGGAGLEPLLHGDIVEVRMHDESHMFVGKALIEVVAAHPAEEHGVYVEFVYRGAEVPQLRESYETAFKSVATPLLHFCEVHPGEECTAPQPNGRNVIHVTDWSKKSKRSKMPSWYEPDWKPPLAKDTAVDSGRRANSGGREERVREPRSSHALTSMDKVRELKERLGKIRAEKDKGQAGRGATGSMPDEPDEHSGPPDRRALTGDAVGEVVEADVVELRRKLKQAEEALEKAKKKREPAGVLADRMADYHARQSMRKETKRHKSRKKRRKAKEMHIDEDSSQVSSSEGSSEESGFLRSKTSGGMNPIQEKARRSPGKLLQGTLKEMSEFLVTRQGSEQDDEELVPVVMSYLTSVLIPSQGQMGMRNTGELRNLAKALDMIIKGNVLGAADVLVQRFKSVESVATGSTWSQAKHHELVANDRISCVSTRERDVVSKMELQDLRLSALQSGRSSTQDHF